MELYLLRHGASLANERMLVCGAADYPLSGKGIAQAVIARRKLEAIPFDRIYTSSLSRAIDTIAGMKKSAVALVVEQLKELDTGNVSHITLPELWAHDTRFRRPWLSPDLRYPGGETFREMIDRISSWYERQSLFWGRDERILVVGHEGTLRVIYFRLMGLALEDYPDFPIGNCDHLYFELSGGRVLRYLHVALAGQDGVQA
jgi:broad specificity phosphatase PhoE